MNEKYVLAIIVVLLVSTGIGLGIYFGTRDSKSGGGKCDGPNFKTAVLSDDDQEYHCVCNPGWYGDECDTKCDTNPCNGHGTCNPKTGTCTCTDGYKGDHCKTPPCPDGCGENATCTADGCKCNPGWYGDECDTKCDTNPCNGRGTCVPETGICNCTTPNYYGDHCDVKCDPITTCNNRGSCDQNGTCICTDGYSGTNCDKSPCPPCGENATCQKKNP